MLRLQVTARRSPGACRWTLFRSMCRTFRRASFDEHRGRVLRDTISLSQVAADAGTVPYEILTAVNPRVPRRYEAA